MTRKVFALLFVFLNYASDTEKRNSSWNKEIEIAMSENYMYLGFSTHPWHYHLPNYSEKSENIEEKQEESGNTKEIFLKALRPICKFCRGKILPKQLLIMKPINGISYHAMCTTGYIGLDSVDFLKKSSNFDGEYGSFYAAIVSIFENTERFINLEEPMIVTELQRQGFSTNQVNIKQSMWEIITALPHIVWWRESTTYGNSIWAIHRKHYGQVGNVDWKAYIIEIMKAQKSKSLAFGLATHRVASITPKSLLQFVKWKTNSSFASALSEIEDLQLFKNGSGVLCVRLKNKIDSNEVLEYSQKPFEHSELDSQLSENEENHRVYNF